jgi:hypothetical protein
MARYYDFILGLIPLAFVGVTGALVLAGVSLTTAVPLGALVSLGFVIHGMFINGPVDMPSPDPNRSERERSFNNSAD